MVAIREPRDVPAAVRDRMFPRLAAFVDAYGATAAERRELVEAVAPCHGWCYAIVQAAVCEGHETFSQQWHGDGRGRAERTGRWLARHAPQLRGALGV